MSEIKKIIEECENESNDNLCLYCEAKDVCPMKESIKGNAKLESKQYNLMYGERDNF
jgi:hypothetical protein